MNDCTNIETRDLLPDFARGVLTGPSVLAVEEHLVTCVSCRAELALLRRAQAALSTPPAVDTSRIVATVIRSRGIQQRTQRAWLAAASVAAIVGATLLATNLVRGPGSSDLPPVVVEFEAPPPPESLPGEPTEPLRSVPRGPARAELVVSGGVSDLADADLESLLRELDGLDAQLEIEPAALVPLLEGEV